MAAPQRDPKSGIWHLRQRTPRDLVERLRKSRITIPIGDGSAATIVVGEIVRISLRTTDERQAKQRHAVADAYLRTFWEDARAPTPKTAQGTSATAKPTRTARPPGPAGGMTWDEAVERFGRPAADVLIAQGVPPTEANQAALIAESASIMDAVYQQVRAKAGMASLPLEPTVTLKASAPPASETVAAGPTITITDLWARYRAYHTDKLAPNTLHRYAASITRLAAHLPERDVRKITDDDIFSWAEQRRDVEGIHPRTINSNDLVALSSMFVWAMARAGGRILKSNPASGVRLDLPRKVGARERTFRDAEVSAILRAALAVDPAGIRDVANQARRWCPWLAAYSGARISELTALKAEDVRSEQGSWIMYFDETKTLVSRSVPIHEHLIEQGFLQFVDSVGSGPLFYDPDQHRKGARTPPFEIRARKVADWVRTVADLDLGVDPNHGWRHTFKTRATDLMDLRIRDAVVGHVPGSTARKYENPSIKTLAEAIRKFPRYTI